MSSTHIALAVILVVAFGGRARAGALQAELNAVRGWRDELGLGSAEATATPWGSGAKPTTSSIAENLEYGRLGVAISRELGRRASEASLHRFFAEHADRYAVYSPTRVWIFKTLDVAGRELAAKQRALLIQGAGSSATALDGMERTEVMLFQDRFDRDDLDGDAIERFAKSAWLTPVSSVIELPSGRCAVLSATALPSIGYPPWRELEPRVRSDLADTLFHDGLINRVKHKNVP